MARPTSLIGPRSVLVAAILVSLLAAPAHAEYINLAWDECGASGISNQTFACDTNAGAPLALIGSFQPPPGINQYLGFFGIISMTANSATLPDWWKHATGECRGTSDLTLSFDYSGNTACTNPYPPGATPAYLLDIGFGGPNKARLRFQAAFVANPVALDPGVEYYGFKFLVSRSKTVGAGACGGCNTEVDFVLDEFQLFQPPEAGYDPRINAPGLSTEVTWQGGATPPTTPQVFELFPAAGGPGHPVEVRGVNFLGATSVRFGATEAAFSVASDSVIQTAVPFGARSGPVAVTSPAGTGSSVTNFVVAPVIVSFDPTSGPAGSTVSIHGYNFVGSTSVQIDGAPAPFTVESDELIEATVPVAADVGPIRVTNPGGIATSSLDFTRVVGGTINLSWDDCGSYGAESKSFACDTNTGAPFPLIGSFVPPPGISEYLGFTAELALSAHSVPDWWKFGAGECRGAAGLLVSTDFVAGPSSCVDFYQGQGQAGYAYQVGFGGPDRARCLIQGGVPFEQRGPVDPAEEYYAFVARITRSKSTGSGSCSGCDDPMTIVLNSIQLVQPTEVGYDPVLTTPGRTTAIWAGDLVGVPAPALRSLALSRAVCEENRRAIAVSLTLPLGAPAKLELFDVGGRLKASRALDGLGAGSHDVRLAVDRPLSAGVYFVRLAQGDQTATRSLTAR